MELVMSKERVTSPLAHHFLRKISFTICFYLNLSLWLPLIILIVFSLFSILISNFFLWKNWPQSLKIEDSTIWLFTNNKILTLVPFKRKLVILVIHKRFFVAAPLKRRLFFFDTGPYKNETCQTIIKWCFFF